MRIAPLAVAVLFAAGFVGCDKKEPAKPAAGNTGGTRPNTHTHDDHGHGEEVELGTVAIGGFSVKVAQQGKVVPGKDTAFEFEVTGGEGKPNAVRAWIGVQDGAGSVKAKAEAEEHGYHAHVDAPAPLPAGSQLWIEVENAKGEKFSASIATK